MNNIIHFAKYSFLWQLKWFVIVNLATLVSLILMELAPAMIPVMGILHFYILLFYSLTSAFSIAGIAHNANPFGSSFSGKYLQALPMSKVQLISVLVLSNLYTLVPLLLSLLWVSVSWHKHEVLKLDIFAAFFEAVGNNFFSVVTIVVLIYFLMFFFQISQMIESPRKTYNKGSLSNFLLMIKGILKMCSIIVVTSTLATYSIYNKTFLPLIGVMLLYTLSQFRNSYKILCNEDRSYWNSKRDLLAIGVYLIVAGAFGYTGYYLSSRGLLHSKAGWQYYYAKGDKAFIDLSNKNFDDVEKYISKNGDISKVNEFGVSLVHSLALTKFKKIKGLEEKILKDPSLLVKPIITKNKQCVESLYCDGVTPIHLLSANGASRVLGKALSSVEDGLTLKNKFKETPLHYASKYCAYRSTKVLLDKGAILSAVDSSGNTALMVAAGKGCIVSAMLLVKKGADLSLKNKNGKTASEIAKEKRHKGLHFLLETFQKGL